MAEIDMMPAHLPALIPVLSRSHRPQKMAWGSTWLSRFWSDRADQVIRNAFMHADDPGLVLDVSTSVERFWPVIMEKPNRRLIVGSADIETVIKARDKQPLPVAAHIYPLKTGFFPIDLPRGAVDCLTCIGLWETGLDSTQRLALLGEFHRLTRECVIVSACVDGNVASWTKDRRPAKYGQPTTVPWRFGSILDKGSVEQEFSRAGFEIVSTVELLPLFLAWRTYVLRKKSQATRDMRCQNS